ncbi:MULTISPECIES: hypothetical protein [Staphylococcus]|uniref:hypothetical protein n=1 Tax=Staphylococcus TaxID=1279 RepID=UPI00119CAB2E|nr:MULTISPECIES: hypothetical protein [Staphylococcus]HCX9014052.1 hypothetical protein [Staphylococcus aureus]MBO1199977.1 hypothetical protein [Staphylococcus simiae]MBO1202247.1 hypothetical protein [Staphylococcus simiae]MBO1212056.1 hypothetical protein [Staphylococcus simiae]MBO1230529.1 hypothetical protein [Staphylococcus simiae]
MDIVNRCNEELTKALEYVKHNKAGDQANFQDKGYHQKVIDGIRGDIKLAHKNMLDCIDEFSKNDIKDVLEKIVEIEETLYQRNE